MRKERSSNGEWRISYQSHRSPLRLDYSLDFSPDGSVLASGSEDNTPKLWNTNTWQQAIQSILVIGSLLRSVFTIWSTSSHHNICQWQEQGNPIDCGSWVHCVRYSPSVPGSRIGSVTTFART